MDEQQNNSTPQPYDYGLTPRRIEITISGKTDRRFAVIDEPTQIWLIFTPNQWYANDPSGLHLWESRGQGLQDIHGNNIENASYRWIDPAPTPDAERELRATWAADHPGEKAPF